MVHAAGLFLIRKDNTFLVGHPTRNKPNVWSIPKGKIEEGETPIDAAVRETFEESNVDASGWKIIHNLEPVKYSKTKKTLHAFALFERQNPIDFEAVELKCNSNVPEEKGGFPEMDGYKWMTFEEGKQCLHETQVACIKIIEELVKKLEKKNDT